MSTQHLGDPVLVSRLHLFSSLRQQEVQADTACRIPKSRLIIRFWSSLAIPGDTDPPQIAVQSCLAYNQSTVCFDLKEFRSKNCFWR